MRAVVSLAPAAVEIEPGTDATITVTISNTTSVVERYDVLIVGDLAPWATVDPPFLNLDKAPEPGSPREEIERERATGQVRLMLRIPRASTPRAGTYPIGVFARATATADASKTAEGSVTIKPFVALVPEIVPQTSRGAFSGRHELTVHNAGNAVAEVTTSASQVDRLLDFNVVPEMIGILPGESKQVRVRAKVKDRAWTGPPQDIPFVVRTDDPMSGPTNTTAFIRQLAIIPSWVRPLAGLALAAAALIVLGPPILVAIGVLPKPSEAAAASTGPTDLPTPVASIQEPSSLQPPTTEPTPTPRVGGPPDEVQAVGDEGDLNTSATFTLDCPPTDATCRQAVREYIQFNLTNLRGVATGVSLTNFRDAPAGTLPLLARWEGLFEYQLRDPGGLVTSSGPTRRVRFDLAPVLLGAPGYVLIDDLNSATTLRFVLDPAEGNRLFDLLYEKTVIPTPAPIPSGGFAFDPSILRAIAGDNQWVVDFQFVNP